MSSFKACKDCRSIDIEEDLTRGNSVCRNCGSVLEESVLVTEANKRIVNPEMTRCSGTSTIHIPISLGWENISREITLKNARKAITNLCHQLFLNKHCIDTACKFYEKAMDEGTTRGRFSNYTHAVCVYLTCRSESTPHMLIDISRATQIPCKDLATAYINLKQRLHVEIPFLDPCIYILRFAGVLGFGNKAQEIANMALHITQRMKYDFLHYGRKPSGICGAALIVAASMYGFNLTADYVAKVVGVTEYTLSRRLREFENTPSGKLSMDELLTNDLPAEDPPSLTAGKRKDDERMKNLTEAESNGIIEIRKEIELQLAKVRRENVITQKSQTTLQSFPREDANTASNDEDNFDDIDDEELNGFILTANEVKAKSELWHKVHAVDSDKTKRVTKARQRKSKRATMLSAKINYNRLKRTLPSNRAVVENLIKFAAADKVEGKDGDI